MKYRTYLIYKKLSGSYEERVSSACKETGLKEFDLKNYLVRIDAMSQYDKKSFLSFKQDEYEKEELDKKNLRNISEQWLDLITEYQAGYEDGLSSFIEEYCLLNRLKAHDLRMYARFYVFTKECPRLPEVKTKMMSVEDERKLEMLKWTALIKPENRTVGIVSRETDLKRWFKSFSRKNQYDIVKELL